VGGGVGDGGKNYGKKRRKAIFECPFL